MEEHNKLSDSVKKEPVTRNGSLGLLALGAVGIRAWRQKRKQSGSENSSSAPSKPEAL